MGRMLVSFDTWDLREGPAGFLSGAFGGPAGWTSRSESPTRRVSWAGPEDQEENSPKETADLAGEKPGGKRDD